MTEETETVSGLKARKVIKMNSDKPEAEIWVSSDLMPVKVRAFGERIRATLPADYFKKVHGNPGMLEIILLYGIPMKMVIPGNKIYQAKVVETSSSSSLFQVPAGYKRVEK